MRQSQALLNRLYNEDNESRLSTGSKKVKLRTFRIKDKRTGSIIDHYNGSTSMASFYVDKSIGNLDQQSDRHKTPNNAAKKKVKIL